MSGGSVKSTPLGQAGLELQLITYIVEGVAACLGSHWEGEWWQQVTLTLLQIDIGRVCKVGVSSTLEDAMVEGISAHSKHTCINAQ